MNFGATGGVVVHVGATPGPVDSRPGDLNIDVSVAEQLITQEMKAIIPVHYVCHACEMDQAFALAGKHGLVVSKIWLMPS
jgi:dTDP-4-amino-4,6-dideoxygalactose transaminase